MRKLPNKLVKRRKFHSVISALAAKKAGGKKLGKPKGTLQESKLDPYKERTKEFLQHGVAKSAIARMLGTSRTIS